MNRNITHIIVHCSDSSFGDVKLIDEWHKERGWNGIGYNFVILNGKRNQFDYVFEENGLIENGRDINISGAHCVGYNKNSIGICMIGVDTFTYTQLTSLIGILLEFIEKYDIPIENILGHYETAKAKGKTCPNFNMDKIRQMLNKKEKNIDLANEYYNEDFDFRFKLKEM